MKRTRAGWAAGLVLLAPLLALPALESSAASPGPAAAAFPGENGKIAFSSNRAGTGGEGPHFDIYVMEPDGSDVTRLTRFDAAAYVPVWSPDGSRIAFAAGEEFGQESIWVMNADGSGLTELTDSPGRDFNPSWSPDGTRIVFESDRGREAGRSQIWVMDADGSNEELLIDAPASGRAGYPSWSPDGRTILYVQSATDPVTGQLALADADGTFRETLGDPGWVLEPDWSPDGSQVAYTENDAGGFNLWVIDLASETPVRLTSGAGRDLGPTWSPDGERIAFSRDDPEPTLWTMAADGAGPARLSAAGEVVEWDPSWQPVPTYELTATPADAALLTGATHTVGFQLDDDVGGIARDNVDLLVEVSGTHPQTQTVVTDAAGQASSSWTGSEVGTDELSVCADIDGDTRCGPDEPEDTAQVTWEPGGPFDEPRLAFTDERDALHWTTVTRDGSFFSGGDANSLHPATTGRTAEPVHEGELSAREAGPRAFVSTRHSPQGEVYLSSGFATTPTRLTCDSDLETHPVVAEDGSVAFASDADGDWDIYLATEVPIINRAAPAWGRGPQRERVGAGALAERCSIGWDIDNLTDEVGDATVYDDLWPAFVDAAGSSALVFSRTQFDGGEPAGLSDLWLLERSEGDWSPTQLTTTPGVAESQPDTSDFHLVPPDSTSDGPPTWVAFTTTEHRADGSVDLMRLGPGEEGTENVIYNPWRGTIPQGSEPTWNGRSLAFTTTESYAWEGDPYGGIWATSIVADDDETPVPVSSGRYRVADEPGVAESHPAWLTHFVGDPDGTVRTADLGFTARVRTDLGEEGDRELDADVSDVLATDGSQRRVVIDEVAGPDAEIEGFRYDEAGPAYSPDGRRLAYSTSDDAAAAGAGTGREIRVASWDGIDVRSLAELTRHRPRDIDRDPVWSPDGTKIAFVRERWDRREGAHLNPRVWVLDLEEERMIPITPRSDSEESWIDWDPDWSPDGDELVVARYHSSSSDRAGRPAAARAGWEYGSTYLWVVPSNGSGVGERLAYHDCPDGCGYLWVEGRQPAWSPDGSTIAYSHQSQIQVIAFFGDDEDAPCCPSPDLRPVEDPVAVTGFEEIGRFTDPRTPTPTRSLLSWTDDPAWSPAGSEIIFSGQPAGQPDQRDIWAIQFDPDDPAGGELRQVTGQPDEEGVVQDGRGPETEPDWQPPPFPADVEVEVSISGSPAVLDEPFVAIFTVTNHGPGYAEDVVLTTGFTADAVIKASPPRPAGCRVNGTGCQFARLESGQSRVYRVQLRHAEPVSGTATGHVTTTSEDPDLTNNSASTTYEVVAAPDVAVTVELDREVGYVGGFRTARVLVYNRGTGTAEGVTLTATWPEAIVATAAPVPDPLPTTPTCLLDGDPCDLGDLDEGEKVVHRVALEGLVEGLGTIDVEISTETTDPEPANDEDSVELEILQPTIRVLPSVARPGEVVLAYAENMPPGNRITLSWSTADGDTSVRRAGIMVDPGPLLVDWDGTARAPLVIVRRDVLGDRLLVATSTTDAFTPVEGPLLVTLRPLAAPQLLGRG